MNSSASPQQRDAHAAWLYSLHGPPGPRSALAPSSPAPFVEPRTAEFRVPVSGVDLEVLLRGCSAYAPACPWQDVWDGEHEEEVSEGKWDIFAEESVGGGVRLHMHRTWTGVKLIELAIETSPRHPLLDEITAPQDDEVPERERAKMDRGARITHITFETHGDYRLKGADEAVYKRVALEVCWWVLGVVLEEEPEK